jgi:hypothetical protein
VLLVVGGAPSTKNSKHTCGSVGVVTLMASMTHLSLTKLKQKPWTFKNPTFPQV